MHHHHVTLPVSHFQPVDAESDHNMLLRCAALRGAGVAW
jgi:hypothetical protein